MKIKTSQLTGAALDWAVAKCEGVEFTYEQHPEHELITYSYSTNWSQGGPILDREKIGLWHGAGLLSNQWGANKQGIPYEHYGKTALIAAMRCFVASKLGDEVDVPEELAP